MKAEQRKELETNTLADKMGHVVKRVKTSPRRTVLIYVVIGAVVILGLVFALRLYRTSQEENSERWLNLDDGTASKLFLLDKSDPDSSAGKAARFQIAWAFYWELGVKRLGVDPPGALKALSESGDRYRKLADDCKDDPLFEPQALLGIAVCEEARAIQDRLRLEKAATLYDEVVKKNDGKYKDTAEGKFAQSRLDQLRDKNGKIRAEVSNVYDDLQKMLRVPDLRAPQLDFPVPGGFNEIGDKKKE
jgi:hypothetical protein